jgi:hypothetical protein
MAISRGLARCKLLAVENKTLNQFKQALETLHTLKKVREALILKLGFVTHVSNTTMTKV